jgi:hypothetical protein
MLAHFFYASVFDKGWDWKFSYFFSVVAIIVLLMHAYYGLIAESVGATLVPGHLYGLDAIARWVLLMILIGGVIVPAALLLAGRYTITRVNQRMAELSEHLGGLLRESATQKVTATEQELGNRA